MALRQPPTGLGSVSVASLKTACGPFLGASATHYDEAVASGVLSDEAVAALPPLRALMEAQSAALADRTAATVGIVELLQRGLSSAQVVDLLTTAPGAQSESLFMSCWVSMANLVCDIVGRESSAEELRLAIWQAGTTAVGFRGFALVSHEDCAHRMWDFYYAQVPQGFGIFKQFWDQAGPEAQATAPQRLAASLRQVPPPCKKRHICSVYLTGMAVDVYRCTSM
jgi:hypothetical protein